MTSPSTPTWNVTIRGQKRDIARLLGPGPGSGLKFVLSDAHKARFELTDPGGATRDDARAAARAQIEDRVEDLNGLGKLRWGRTFEGVEIEEVRVVDPDCRDEIVGFLGVAVDFMTWREMERMRIRLGRPPRPEPDGLSDIEGLDLPTVERLLDNEPSVRRVLHLIRLAHSPPGNELLDWALAYAAWEAIQHDARSRGWDGAQLGWWTRRELRAFRGTANSPEALGSRARHGEPRGLPASRMNDSEASHFVRKVAARWIKELL